VVKRKIANEFRAVAPRVIQKVNRKTFRVESMVTTHQSLFSFVTRRAILIELDYVHIK